MTKKQERFIIEYLIDLNATQAAIRSGYSKKTAYSIGSELLSKPEIKSRIEGYMQKMKSARVAELEEVLEYLTSVMRGESRACVVAVEGTGDGCSSANIISKPPNEQERLKAAELLGRRHGMFNDKIKVDGAIPIVIKEDL